MSKTLDGRVAIVTGGARGIGAAIVLRLAEEGANVAFSYLNAAERAQELVKEVETNGVRGLAVKADTGESRQVVNLVHFVHQHFGKLDILVNSAGLSLTGAVDDSDPDLAAFDRQFAVNVTGLATAVRTAVPFLLPGSRIINIGTVFASRSPLPGWGD